MQPRVAITLGSHTKEHVCEQYRSYLANAGADAHVYKPGDLVDIEQIDGLVLGGGADVHPREYGQAMAGTVEPEPERDTFERELAEAALAAGTPVLGICRGLQYLNVLFGGTLIQHLDGHSRDAQGESARHEVVVAPGSRLHEMVGKTELPVNSSHHQGLRAENLAPGLRATAFSQPDLIEAVEAADGRWLVAVQWHPERVNEVDPACAEIARGFVRAAAAFARTGKQLASV